MSAGWWMLDQVAPRGQARSVAPTVGRVTRITADGVYVVFGDYSEQHEFGPFPWNHAGATPTPPSVDDFCLVVYLDNGIGRGFVVAWSPTVPWV